VFVLTQVATNDGFWTDAKWGVLITGLVGVAGLVATAWTARRGRVAAKELAAQQQAHDERMRADDHTHEEALRRHERVHDHRAALYVELLATVLRGNESMERTEPMMTWEGAPGPPEPLSMDEQRLLTAKVDAYASSEVIELLGQWRTNLRDFERTVFELRDARDERAHGGDATTADHYKHLQLTRQRAHELYVAMATQIAAELRG
jgi:hypothetical protein